MRLLVKQLLNVSAQEKLWREKRNIALSLFHPHQHITIKDELNDLMI